ncbi:uncharacterized protein B0H18DRAFT_1121959 [Fomitopsis serialis]|uniref:uncharacterized protein n=1 Tax=Fomitopsis serialis TaxID=139415 RepID=UPI00200835AF|nr:uncharacterized protein B0H18DRAFT_1121959 [Neoantrodia serialis]KAH9920363.1 hypothetical protein B0H18DRAFT_1121959 [Neoantrodia serialis]
MRGWVGQWADSTQTQPTTADAGTQADKEQEGGRLSGRADERRVDEQADGWTSGQADQRREDQRAAGERQVDEPHKQRRGDQHEWRVSSASAGTNGASAGTNSSVSTSRVPAEYTGSIMHIMIIDGVDCSPYVPSASSQTLSLTLDLRGKLHAHCTWCSRSLRAVVYAREPELGEHSVEHAAPGLYWLAAARTRPPSTISLFAVPHIESSAFTTTTSPRLYFSELWLHAPPHHDVPERIVQVVEECKCGTKRTSTSQYPKLISLTDGGPLSSYTAGSRPVLLDMVLDAAGAIGPVIYCDKITVPPSGAVAPGPSPAPLGVVSAALPRLPRAIARAVVLVVGHNDDD